MYFWPVLQNVKKLMLTFWTIVSTVQKEFNPKKKKKKDDDEEEEEEEEEILQETKSKNFFIS